MPQSIPALVQPPLLVWARESAGMQPEAAAAKAGIEAETLLQWERGDDRPTISQLRKLCEVYKRPLAVFFLPEPPRGFDPQREFRRLPGLTPQKESPEMRLALRTALFRREAAKELYERLGETNLVLDVKARPNEDAEVVGRRIRDVLGITWEKQLRWSSAHAALNGWREGIENLGILVFQTSGIEVDEMRGISIPSGPLPVILLNNADAPHGRIFTLVHEFAHVLLTNGGHRTSTIEGQRSPEDQVLERVSNRFAATALLPKNEFLIEAGAYPEARNGNDDALRRFANHIKVSPEAILRRMVSLHLTSAALYKRKRSEWQKRTWYVQPSGEGGPPLEVKVVSSVGRPFVSLILESYQRSAISSSDVSDYLGVQLKYLDRIVGELTGRPGASALAS